MSRFLASQQPGGAHHWLAQLAGRWQGVSRLWLEPDKLTDESPVSATIRLILGGRFALHEYENRIDGQDVQGLALHGYDLAAGRFTTAWVDSFHNGTAIMLSEGQPGWPQPCDVKGSYPDGQGGPRWSWRTSIELPGQQRLILRHFNIDPSGPEALAAEFDYSLVAG